ncbi:MAG: exodeoxyribonuclease VII large subunit [Pseudomonadota bacterium]
MNSLNTQTILTVSQLTAEIKDILESQYRFVRISGEISNLKTPFSGHSYFTLKDAGAQIRAVLFKQQKRFTELTLQDGQQVVVFGRISVYEPRGEYQIVIDSVELYGIGKLLREFEQLKRKLADKGYFAAEFKKPLPPYPGKIVVISSPTGAAIQDFLKIIGNRKSPVHIQILPVKVQGKGAAAEIARAIEIAQGIADTDIIVLCRGGGSIEDLWAFNEEIVAEAIHRSALPVVTGIGHEIDFTIADFCADFRCPTPTGVAEKLVPDAAALRRHIGSLRSSLEVRIARQLHFFEQQLLHHKKMLGDMRNVFNRLEFRLNLSEVHLAQAMTDNLQTKEQRLRLLARRLHDEIPTTRIDLHERQIDLHVSHLNNYIQRLLERKRAALAEQATLLHGLSPLAILARGYAIVRKKQQKEASWRAVSRGKDAQVGEELNILLQEGQLDCVVTRSE